MIRIFREIVNMVCVGLNTNYGYLQTQIAAFDSNASFCNFNKVVDIAEEVFTFMLNIPTQNEIIIADEYIMKRRV